MSVETDDTLLSLRNGITENFNLKRCQLDLSGFIYDVCSLGQRSNWESQLQLWPGD